MKSLALAMKVLFLELNEFDFDLLKEGATKFQLENLERLTQFHKSETWTDDTYESEYLEPWVQWVSVHTGTPSSEHRVKHLGDVSNLKGSQLWEKLSERGVSSGIWGAMNATRGGADRCLFFFPDLWTASEKGFPKELDSLLEPLRVTSKNYTNRAKNSYLKDVLNFVSVFKANDLHWNFAREVFSLGLAAVRHSFKPFVFVSFTDNLSTQLFLKYKEKCDPDFSLLFLNSLAHLQHHQWSNKKIEEGDPLAHGFQMMDRIMGKIFDSMKPDDLLIVANALGQKNTSDEKPWVLYRQIDQQKFVETIGIEQVKVEAHMTHDAHLFFPSPEKAKKGEAILRSAEIEGVPLFHVEAYEDEPTKLFYRIQFTDPLPKEAVFRIGKDSFRFFDLFTAIVQRTGRHIQTGVLLCNQPRFPKKLSNHEISNKILEFFSD